MVSLPTYDSTKVSSLSLSPDQVGASTIFGGWTPLTFPFTQSFIGNSVLGFSFDFSVSTDAERGLALAPTLPFTAATDDLAGTGETAKTWDLTIATGVTSIPVVTRYLYGVTTHTPPDFSASYPPSAYFSAVGGAFLIEAITAASTAWVLNGSVYDLVWSFDFLTNRTDAVSGAAVTSPLFMAVHDPRWTGKIQFILSHPIIGSTTITGATFAGYAHKWHTGATNFQMNRRGRVVHDYITSQTYLSDEAVPDGYREGIMVHPSNYDPPDEVEPFIPPPGEGVVDDEVIDPENS